jgi:tape measure domain-containing protein
MASLASINIVFRVDLRSLSTGMQSSIREMNKFGDALKDVGKSLTYSLTAPLVGLGAVALKTFAEIDSLNRGLASVEGSTKGAAIEFKALEEVAKLPGLGLEEAVRGSVRLQAAGESADDARKELLAFGNALATVGKGKRELDLVILALTQLSNKETGFGQDLRQLTEQLPQLRGALTAAFGTADSEKIAKLGVTGKQVVTLLTKEFEKLPKVTGGIGNAFENTTDAMTISSAKLGEAINKAFNVEGFLNSFSESLKDLATSFQELSPSTQAFVLGAAAVAAAIGPLAVAVGAFITFIPVLITGFAAISASILPVVVGIGLLMGAYLLLKGRTAELTTEQIKLADAKKTDTELNDDATRSIAKQRLELDQLVVTARNVNEPMAKREAAIKAINKISPEYLGNLSLETIRTDEATIALAKYNEALFKGALARAAQKKIDANAEKRVNAQLQFEQKAYEFQQKKAEAALKGAAELEKFNNANYDKFAYTLLLYDEQLKKLDVEDKRVFEILKKNKDYLGLLKLVGAQETANFENGAKAGTIKYYEDQIAALKKLQDEFETTPQGVAALESKIEDLQLKIDKLKNIRVKVTSVVETIEDNKLQAPLFSYGENDARIKELQKERDAFLAVQSRYEEGTVKFEEYAKRIKQLDFAIDFNQGGNIIEPLNRTLTEAEVRLMLFKDRMAEINLQFTEGITKAFETAAEGVLTGFGEILGGLASGATGIQDIFGLLGSTLGNLLIELGKIAIQTAIGIEAIKTALKTFNPFVAAAAGVALIALGSVIKNKVKDAGAFAEGGIVGGASFTGDRLFARVNSGEMILNERQQRNLYSQIQPASTGNFGELIVGGTFVVDGQSLRLVLDRTDKRNNRLS